MADNKIPQIGAGERLTEVIRTQNEIDSQTRQWQLSGFDIIEEIRHRLQGEIPKDDPSSQFVEWIPITDPLANQKGINELCWYLSNYINKNMQLSYFTPEQINVLLTDFECALSRKMETDWRRMGIRKEDLDSVFLMIANTVWAGVNRARFGGEKQFIEGTEQRRIISHEDRGDNKGSWMDKLPIIGKG